MTFSFIFVIILLESEVNNMKYLMRVVLELEDEIEANTPEEAFSILSDYAISGGDWRYSYKEITETESEE